MQLRTTGFRCKQSQAPVHRRSSCGLCFFSQFFYVTNKLQFIEHGNQVKEFFNHVEATYRHGKPLHIADPEMSAFDILPYEEFQAMSASRVQERLRFKHILITGCPHPNMKFDEAGLRTLCSLDRPVSIQGTN